MPEPATEPHPPRPRVLFALLAVPIAFLIMSFAAGFAVQAIAAIKPEFITDNRVSHPLALAAMLVVGQLALLVAVIAYALLSPVPTRPRLGLTPPRLPLWGWPLLLGANLFIWWGTSTLTPMLFEQTSDQLQWLATTITSASGWMIPALILAAGVLPGLCEELLVRGVLQRRLIRAWPAWLAVLTSAVVFALIHTDPMHMVLVFPLGLFWSITAWRTGSTITAMALHAFNNAWALSLAWIVTAPDATRLAPLFDRLTIPFIAVTALCLLATLLFLFRTPAPKHAGAEPL